MAQLQNSVEADKEFCDCSEMGFKWLILWRKMCMHCYSKTWVPTSLQETHPYNRTHWILVWLMLVSTQAVTFSQKLVFSIFQGLGHFCLVIIALANVGAILRTVVILCATECTCHRAVLKGNLMNPHSQRCYQHDRMAVGWLLCMS